MILQLLLSRGTRILLLSLRVLKMKTFCDVILMTILGDVI